MRWLVSFRSLRQSKWADRREHVTELTPQKKKEAEQRLAPVTRALVSAAQFKLDLTNLLVEIGPSGFDPQDVHRRITAHFDHVRKSLDGDLVRIKRMLAFEALGAAGKLSAAGGADDKVVSEKMKSMDVASRRLQQEALAQDQPSAPIPR
jgi:hypothetical protein